MMRLHSVTRSCSCCLFLNFTLAILFLINSPANKVGVLNARAEERRHFKVFPLECITELLSQTVANRDRQIEVVTQEADEKERERSGGEMKRHGGVPPCCFNTVLH